MDDFKVGVTPGELGACEEPVPSPCAMVIFGASGDLTARKLVPALYRLSKEGLLSENFFVMGLARTKMIDGAYRELMREAVERAGIFEERSWKIFAQRLYYRSLDYSASASYEEVASQLLEKDKEHSTG